MFLKIMSGEASADGDSRKSFRMLDNVTAVNFERSVPEKDKDKLENRLIANRGPKAEVTFGNGDVEIFWPEGNCYVLNDKGDTIESFGVSPPVSEKVGKRAA